MAVIPHLFDMERPFRMIERQLITPDEFFGFSPHHQLVPQVNRSQCNPWNNLIRPLEQLSSTLHQLALNEPCKITKDDEKFQVNIDVQHFSPDEIDVKVINGHVVVEGKHEEKMDDHGFVSRQFVRRYALPKSCLPDTVESNLSSDGVLTVTAPKVLAMPSTGERIVPITKTGPVKKLVGSAEAAIKELQ